VIKKQNGTAEHRLGQIDMVIAGVGVIQNYTAKRLHERMKAAEVARPSNRFWNWQKIDLYVVVIKEGTVGNSREV
jgi:hypothetical protein